MDNKSVQKWQKAYFYSKNTKNKQTEGLHAV